MRCRPRLSVVYPLSPTPDAHRTHLQRAPLFYYYFAFESFRFNTHWHAPKPNWCEKARENERERVRAELGGREAERARESI